MSFAFYLPRVVQVLETVKVDAKQDRRHELLFVDAATIASSGEDLDNAFDVMRKLRPRILKGWHTDFCGTGSDGLHGQGSIFGDRRSMSAPAELAPFPSDQANPLWVNGVRIFPEFVLFGDFYTYVYKKIKAEHIAQIRRVECDEPSPFPNHPLGVQDAIFIVLKPCVRFDFDKGSYVENPCPGMR